MTKQKNMRARVGMRARAGTTTMTMMRMMNPSCSERDMQPIEYSASSASMHYIWGLFKLGKKSTLRQEKNIYIAISIIVVPLQGYIELHQDMPDLYIGRYSIIYHGRDMASYI